MAELYGTKCSKCGRIHTENAVRPCPHPAVKKVFGDDAKICVWCCKGCKFVKKIPYTSALGCSYE